MEDWLSKYRTVDEVVDAYNLLPKNVKQMFDIPRHGGGRLKLDREKILELLQAHNDPEEDECHVLLPYGNLVDFICEGMACKACGAVITRASLAKTTVGIATSLEYVCRSKECDGARRKSSKARSEAHNYISSRLDAETIGPGYDAVLGEGCRDKRSVSNYAANWRLLAATQLVGESEAAGTIFAGFLGLAPTAFRNQWFNMEAEVGEAHDKLANQCMLCNLEEAVEDKQLHANGKAPLTISFDMGWQKSGRAMNSQSGHAFVIDVNTSKVLAMQVYSKQCITCSNFTRRGYQEDNMPKHKCSKNYDGSSKGMEATAALEMVKRVFEHEHVKAFVAEMVIDDDASTRALLRHSLEELLVKVTDFNWPRDVKGRKLPKNVGKLPWDHPVIKFLADLTHRIRTFGKHVFQLAAAPKSTSTCTLVDAYHLKRNFGY